MAPGDFLARFLRTILQTRQFPDGGRRFEFTTVDRMARQVWATVSSDLADLSSDPTRPKAQALRKIVHLTGDGDSASLLSFSRIGELAAAAVSDSARRPQRVSAATFLRTIAQRPDCALYPLLEIIQNGSYFGHPESDMPSRTAISLSSQNVTLDSSSEQAIRCAVDRMVIAQIEEV
jgi:thioester reductase-like protein